MLKFFANVFWIYTPGFFQKEFSRIFSGIFSFKISRFFIIPYCLMFGLSQDYLDQFEPESGKEYYSSYFDFFKRKYKNNPKMDSKHIWPCEGYVCDWGYFKDKNQTTIKGHNIDLNQIFNSKIDSNSNYYFVNIFLHNHNYHRVHSPVSGTITEIKRISGNLVFLRPWFYKKGDESFPAFRNERVVYQITDNENKVWYIALVGGFGVGTIETSRDFLNGGPITTGQEFSRFHLGSTVCIASPYPIQIDSYLQEITVGETLFQYANSKMT